MDNTATETLKADITTSTEMLFSLLGNIMAALRNPRQKERRFCGDIAKKGDLRERKNYCAQLRGNQADFRQRRSCSDQILTTKMHCGAGFGVEYCT